MRTINSYFSVMARLSAIHFAGKFGQYNIGAGEHKVIDYVCGHPGTNQDEVSTYFRMNKGVTSRMVQSLVKKGFILAVTSEGDKRQRLLFPTEAGTDIFPLLISSKWEWDQEITEGVMIPREELLAALEIIESNMKKRIEQEKLP